LRSLPLTETGSETVTVTVKRALTLRRLKGIKCYIFERMFDGIYLRNNRKQNEQQSNPDGKPTEQNQHIHRHLIGGPHRLQTGQQRTYLGPSTLHKMYHVFVSSVVADLE
jgi:hypothetical protein